MDLFYSEDVTKPSHLFSAEESKHICKVFRLQKGDDLFLTNGKGEIHRCEIASVSAKQCEVTILSTEVIPYPSPSLHIAIAPTKNISRFEWFLEKATEIGISTITPLICSHSERKTVKTERLGKVLVAAMKQSQKSWLPALQEPISLTAFARKELPGQKFIAYCEAGTEELLTREYKPGSQATILIGPEGDFSSEEVELAKKSGYVPASLGDSRLRTETAGVVACVTFQNANFAP